MSMNPLHEVYPCLGEQVEIYFETGHYDKESGRFQREDLEGESFAVARNLGEEIGLDVGDRVTIATFENRGAMFLSYNHTKRRYRCYPEAIDDLPYHLKGGESALGRVFLSRKLAGLARSFPESDTFARVLRRVEGLAPPSQRQSFQPSVPARTAPGTVVNNKQRESTKAAAASARSDGPGMNQFRRLLEEHFHSKNGKYGHPDVCRRLAAWFSEEFLPQHRSKSFEAICRAWFNIHPDKAVNMPFTRDELQDLFTYFRPILEAELRKG